MPDIPEGYFTVVAVWRFLVYGYLGYQYISLWKKGGPWLFCWGLYCAAMAFTRVGFAVLGRDEAVVAFNVTAEALAITAVAVMWWKKKT